MKKTNKLLLSSLVLTLSMLIGKSIIAAAAGEDIFAQAIADSKITAMQEEKKQLEEELSDKIAMLAVAESPEDKDMAPTIIASLEERIAYLNAKLELSELEKELKDKTAMISAGVSQKDHNLIKTMIASIEKKISVLKSKLKITRGEQTPSNGNHTHNIPTTRPSSATLDLKCTQLTSVQQKQPTCGFRTVANARAITDQFAKGLPITPGQTQTLATKCFEGTLKKSAIFANCRKANGSIRYQTETEVKELVKSVFATDHNGDTPGVYILSPDETTALFQHHDSVLAMVEHLRHGNQVLHFIMCEKSHWTLLSIIPTRSASGTVKYEAIYLDSLNNPMQSRPGAMHILENIKNIVRMVTEQ